MSDKKNTKKNREENVQNIEETTQNIEKIKNNLFQIKKSKLIMLFVLIFLIVYTFFMPSYQKQMISNLNPFKTYSSENQQLENVIAKEKIVELPSKKAQNLAAFLDEFNRYDDFRYNPNYGNLLDILDDIELQTIEENKVFAKVIVRNYKDYINKKLFEESAIEDNQNEEVNDEEVDYIDEAYDYNNEYTNESYEYDYE